MVEGLFAGYKVLHDARWNGEYLVYDRMAYENWNGQGDLPVHTTKELYVPGTAADSKDLPNFQFPVRDGDWVSKAPTLNRYVHGRKYKKKRPIKKSEKPAAHDDENADAVITAEIPDVSREPVTEPALRPIRLLLSRATLQICSSTC